MNIIKKVLAWIYGIQAIIVVPWFLGAICRREQSLWVWEEYSSVARSHGTMDTILSVYLYSIFYFAPFLATILTLWIIPKTRNLSSVIVCLIGIWVSGTFLFLFPMMAEFIRSILDTWNGWLFILWSGSTIFIGSLLWFILKKEPKRENEATEGRTKS